MAITSLTHMIGAGAIAGVALLVGGQPAEAGLFDFLFGGGDGFAQPQRHYGGAPLDVRVNPRRRVQGQGKGQGGTLRARVRTGPKDKKVAERPKIDPIKNPNWYLEDQTLRRGDIVVLKGGKVVVFEGGRAPFASSDFTSLQQSRLVSKSDREKIEKMARRDPNEPDAAPAPQAAADPIPAGPPVAREATLRPAN